MATQIKLRRDTAANWASENPTPAHGEPCFETDTNVLKIGDGTTAYNSLPSISSTGSGDMVFADDVIDEDDMASNLATKVPTQQSVKAYVDTEIAAAPGSGDMVFADDVIDEDTMASSLDTKVPTQQSVKVYVDTEIAGVAAGSVERGVLILESFAGADDDAKMAAANSFNAGQTFKRPIALYEGRVYTFNDPVDLYNGFALVGPPRHGGQPVTTPRYPHEVKIDIGTQPFLRMPASGTIYNVHVSNLSFEAQGSGEVFLGYDSGGAAGSVLWTSVIRDVSFSLFDGVIGTEADRLLMTGNTFDGFWNINNGRGVAVHVGGSDNNLFLNGCLLDSPTSLTNTGDVSYHMWLDYLEKSNVGPIYITCEGDPAGIRIDGSSSSGGAITFHGGMRVEGRNAGASSLGACIHMNGGQVVFRDAWIAYGYSNFAGLDVNVVGRAGEGGVVHISGGKAVFDGCTYARAGTDGVADTVPFIYATGAGTEVRIVNQQVATDGGTFTTTGKAHVRAVSGAEITYHDQSITDVDASYKIPGYGNVNHGAVASTARPTTHEHYIWTGTVEPTNKTGQDIAVVEQ